MRHAKKAQKSSKCAIRLLKLRSEFPVAGCVKAEGTWLVAGDDGKEVKHQWMTLEVPFD